MKNSCFNCQHFFECDRDERKKYSRWCVLWSPATDADKEKNDEVKPCQI